MITFIIPQRGKTSIDIVLQKLKQMYSDAKYIVMIQDDNMPFMRGQLFNIAFNYVDTDYICLHDNDLFFDRYIDLETEYNKLHKIALQPYDVIKQVKIVNDKVIELCKYVEPWKGGSTFMSSKNFKLVNGYSNLYIGYGVEDSEFNERCHNIARIENTSMCHIAHKKRNNLFPKNISINVGLGKHIKQRDWTIDGWKDTRYKVTNDITKDNVRYISVRNITVDKNFPYISYIKKHYSVL